MIINKRIINSYNKFIGLNSESMAYHKKHNALQDEEIVSMIFSLIDAYLIDEELVTLWEKYKNAH